MRTIPTHREPSHPGEILKEEYLIPLGITQTTLANDLEIPYQRINEILNKKRGITPSTALRLAIYFNTTPDFLDESPTAVGYVSCDEKGGKSAFTNSEKFRFLTQDTLL